MDMNQMQGGGMQEEQQEMVPCPMCGGHGAVPPEVAAQAQQPASGADPAQALAQAMSRQGKR